MRGAAFIIGIFAMLFISACGEKQEAPPPAPKIQQAPVVQAVPEPPKEKQVYVYAGDRFRDPFLPAGVASSYKPDAVFDPQRAAVKAIIFGNRLKSAVLAVGSSIYFIKESRIHDIMGKNVDGYTAKVFVDKVIISSGHDAAFELKIRSDEEEEKS